MCPAATKAYCYGTDTLILDINGGQCVDLGTNKQCYQYLNDSGCYSMICPGPHHDMKDCKLVGEFPVVQDSIKCRSNEPPTLKKRGR
jgi:hypothetical protein